MGSDVKAAKRTETSRGVVWKWPHSTKSFFSLKAADFEVRDIPEKGIVVILCKDGVSSENDWDEKGELDEVVKQANQLLDFRWREGWLMAAIVDSPEFAAGDYRGAIESGFWRVDDAVEKMVKQMNSALLDWSEALLWRAFYNTVVVIVTPEAVHMGGGGSFGVKSIQMDAHSLVWLSSNENMQVASAKAELGNGPMPEGFDPNDPVVLRLEEARKRARNVTMSKTYRKYGIKECGQCIVVEQYTPWCRTGGDEWLAHGEDWGGALTAVSLADWSLWRHYGGMVLALAHPHDSNENHFSQVPAPCPAFPAPCPAFPSEASVNRPRERFGKRHKTEPEPIAV